MNLSAGRSGPGPTIPALFSVGSVFLWSMTSLAAQSVVAGTVRQDSSRRPLAGVEVVMEKPKRQTVTDAAGHFAFESIPKGDHVVLLRSVGYRPARYKVRVAESDTVQADALVVAFAVPLEPIKVTAPKPSASMMGLEGFEERRSNGWGKFIDSTELRRADGLRLPDLLRQTAKIRLVTAGREVRAASATLSATNGVPCYMQVFLDGMALFRPISPSSYFQANRASCRMNICRRPPICAPNSRSQASPRLRSI